MIFVINYDKLFSRKTKTILSNNKNERGKQERVTKQFLFDVQLQSPHLFYVSNAK